MAKPKRTCSVEGCNKPLRARGFCNSHLHRLRRHGDPLKGGPPLTRTHTRNGKCSVEDCENPSHTRGLCRAHYKRQWRHGDPLAGRPSPTPKGEALEYIYNVVLPYKGKDCLIWPYPQNSKGYGTVTFDGRMCLVSRLVCAHIHGPAPTEKHEAAHKCGRGHEGCVNPQHLRWATRLQNVSDKFIHGTIFCPKGILHGKAKLTESDVRAIRQMTDSYCKLSAKFNVSKSLIAAIKQGKIWRHLKED